MKVLIAEDEPMESRALGMILRQYYLEDIEEIFVADNGRRAVDMVRELRPDLVFMDIQMPVLDGLSASREIRSFDGGVEIIMLTAYSDFEYARQAIGNRTLEYIVKPYSVKTLRATMDKAAARIDDMRRERMERDSSRRLVSLLQREFLHKVMVNFRLREDIIRRYVQMIGVSGNAYRIVFFQPDLLPPEQSGVWDELFSRLDGAGFSHMYTYFSQAVCVIPYAEAPERLGAPLERLMYDFGDCHPDVDFLASEVLVRWEDVAVAFYHTFTRLINPSGAPAGGLAVVELEERLAEATISRDAARAREICREIVDKAFQRFGTSNDFGFTLIAAYRGLLRSLYAVEHEKLEGILEGFDAGFNVPYRGDTEQGFADLWGSVEALIGYLVQHVQGRNSRIIHQVKKYIDEHYGEYVSLEHIAKHVAMSKYYLSRTFKSQEGETIVGYLQRFRIEKAKVFLLQGGTASDVCYLCGFSDPAYFGKSFKRMTGMSPAGFARKYSGDELDPASTAKKS